MVKVVIQKKVGRVNQKKPISTDIDFGSLATLTEGKSGAFLEAVVNRANTEAFRERRRINHHDLEMAAKNIDGTRVP